MEEKKGNSLHEVQTCIHLWKGLTIEKSITFFQDLTHYVEEGDGRLGNYITDVVVVRDNQEEHYQISDTGMLNIDSGQFFCGNIRYV